jgi:hypothetical protein
MPVELYANSAQTTLAGALTSGATTLTVASSAPFPVPAPAAVPPTQFRARIDAELLIVTAVSGTTWTVTRAAEGTTAAAHSSGATVTHVVTASPLQSLMARNFGASSEMVLLSDYPGWESTTASVATAARDQAATAAWGGSYTRMLGIPHHPTASGHVWDAPLGYVEGMGLKGLGTSSREFNGAGDVQIQYSGASQFVAWVNGINRFIRFEDLLFSGAQTIPSASQFFVASGAMELRDSEFINCSWKFYQNVFDTPCTRVRIMGETYINNGSGTQLYLRGSDCKLLGEMFIDGYPMANDQYMVKISLNQSEIDRMYITPAPHMGILFTGTCAGLRARLVINGLTTMLGATGYATTAAFPAASTVTGQLFKANNDIKTYRSNGTTYDVFWDGVAPTNVTSLPGSPTQGQLVADTNDDVLIRHYRYDGSLWHGPKFHLSSTVASYDGTDGPGVTFQDVKGSLDLDLYIQQTGNYVVSGFRRGAVQILDCVDEISARIDHDYLNPHSSIYHYDIRDTNLPAGTAVKVRLTDNLGRPHLAGRVDTPRINASGEVQIEYPRRTAQWATRRPPSTLSTAPPSRRGRWRRGR